MDVWTVGRVPAGAYSYAFPPEHVKKNPGNDSARVSPIVSPLADIRRLTRLASSV